jgi:hypothetical protein
VERLGITLRTPRAYPFYARRVGGPIATFCGVDPLPLPAGINYRDTDFRKVYPPATNACNAHVNIGTPVISEASLRLT